jgi:serine/threonine-protein kinase
VLADVLKTEPDLERLPEGTPVPLRRLVRRCLCKKPASRLRDIGDARLELAEAASGAPEDHVVAPAGVEDSSAPRRVAWLPSIVATVAAGVLVGAAVWAYRQPSLPPVQRFTLQPPAWSATNANTDIAISPNGRHFAYMGLNRSAIHLRALDEYGDRALRGTDAGYGMSFSPEGRWIAFWNYQTNTLLKVSVDGGTPVTLAEFEGRGHDLRGARWESEDAIVFATQDHDAEGGDATGVLRVSAAGDGEVEELTTVDDAQGEFDHWWPEVLPGGRAIVFCVVESESTGQTGRIVAQDLTTGERTIIVREGSNPRYLAATGHLLYALGGTMWAIEFDAASLATSGEPFIVLEGINTKPSGAANFDVTSGGTLLYRPGDAGMTDASYGVSLAWIDRGGRIVPVRDEVAAYHSPRLSPDGTRIAVAVGNEVWIYDTRTDSMQLLAPVPEGLNMHPVWSPDGAYVVFGSGPTLSSTSVARAAADFSGDVEILVETDSGVLPSSYSPAGDLLFASPSRAANLGATVLRPDGSQEDLFAVSEQVMHPRVSPDGKWVAYQSGFSGQAEIYVQPFPGGGQKTIVSSGGGVLPVWSRTSDEIFYRQGDSLIAVDYTTEGGFAIVPPRETVFTDLDWPGSSLIPGFGRTVAHFDGDGERFLIVRSPTDLDTSTGAAQSRGFNIVLNWLQEFEGLAVRAR